MNGIRQCLGSDAHRSERFWERLVRDIRKNTSIALACESYEHDWTCTVNEEEITWTENPLHCGFEKWGFDVVPDHTR